ncbi:unnamed protein product, partial [Protopolystoma xenopodis]
ERDTTRRTLVARLVSAYARFDEVKAAEVASRYTVGTGETSTESQRQQWLVPKLSEADVDKLETAFLFGAKYMRRIKASGEVHQTPSGETVLSSATSARLENAVKRRQRKKKRKIHLPKDFQPGTLPDPERWLPKRERTYYRGKRRDKRSGALTRGPQGQATGAAEL